MQANNYLKEIAFPNGYSASIVCHDNSYGGSDGLFEIAVIHNNKIVYDTPITSDVLGFLTFSGVADALEKISNLPSRQ